MAQVIFLRTPFLIEVNEASQIQTKVEIKLRKVGDAFPTSPQYTLSKYIPSSNKPNTVYNISPYVQEFITNKIPTRTFTNTDLPTDEYCEVAITSYYNTGSGWLTADTYQFYAFNGYTPYEDGKQAESSVLFLNDIATRWYYKSEPTYRPQVNVFCESGAVSDALKTARYHDLTGVASYVDVDLTALDGWKLIPAVYALFTDCKLELIDVTDTIIETIYSYSVEECKYTPYRVDYVNKLGVWDQMHFYKASNESVKVSSKNYNLLQSDYDYDATDGTKKVYNKMGNKSVKVNSGWVDEVVKQQIEELMMSERILLSGKPVMLKTESTELYNHLNNKQINYQLEFEYSNEVMSNVI